MDELQKIHEVNLEWGCITNLMNKISDLEDKIEGGWPELIDMVVEAIETDENSDPQETFFNLYQFLFRLYYRLKVNPTVREFNKVTKTKIVDKEVYRVTNYNYSNYKWAKANGFIGYISNDVIDLEADKLTDKTRRALDKRCQ